MGKHFEDFEIGEESWTAGRTITETDIVNFAGITGDWNEIHTNAELAARGPFKQRIAPELRVVREGKVRLYPVAELERWADERAEKILDDE